MSSSSLEVPVVRADEGGVTAYLGRMRASDVLAVYDLRRWSETELDGYQRQLYEERKKQVAKYLRECPIPVIPAVLVTIGNDSDFVPYDKRGSLGHLRIPMNKGAIHLIDGQHRMAGFQWFLDELAAADENKRLGVPAEVDDKALEKYRQMLGYEVPVLFVDGEQAARIVQAGKAVTQRPTDKRDVERALFLILNKTQKGIRPSLKDTLQFMIWRAGISGIPGLDDVDRVKATELVLRLNSDGSPLAGMINASGARGLHRPVQLSSFVTSLEPLYDHEGFNRLSEAEKYQFIKSFWGVLKGMYPQAFEPESWRKYLVLKTVGVYVLNRIARDFLKWADANAEKPTAATVERYLSPLKEFDWYRETSPLKGFQGLGGVDVAYDNILKSFPQLDPEGKRRVKAEVKEN